MPPRKQPPNLFSMCVKKSINVINSACYAIEERFNQTNECEKEALRLKTYLKSVLPARMFDVLCSEKTRVNYHGDTRIQLLVLMHPEITVFRNNCGAELGSNIPEIFWINNLSNLARLVVLDLAHICTDRILKVVANNCPLIEEINIISVWNIGRNDNSLYVSDKGLEYVKKLTRLRILEMDSPIPNDLIDNNDLCQEVTIAGVIGLIKELRYLEEVRINNFSDVTKVLLDTPIEVPLNLTKVIDYRHNFPDGITRLSKICRFLKQLHVLRHGQPDFYKILQQILDSDLKINELGFKRITFSDMFVKLLKHKGVYLTHLLLWKSYNINFEAVLLIGEYCPHLRKLCLASNSESPSLVVPKDYQKTNKFFSNLKYLILSCMSGAIRRIVTFFVDYADNLERLVIDSCDHDSDIIDYDMELMFLLATGYLKSITYLSLPMNLIVSNTVIMSVIQTCEKLETFTVYCADGARDDVYNYVRKNNLDLKLYVGYTRLPISLFPLWP